MTIFTTFLRRLLFAASAFATICPDATTQQVLLSEIRGDGTERWVELHNRGAAAVDLSTWSLYYATHTIWMAQTYWWPFPNGTVLPAGGYLRVHWYQVGSASPGELWTGVSPYGFLFGLGGEPLSGGEGAFGLFRTQQNGSMNDPSQLVDWVGWGSTGFEREAMAAQAGLWTAGRAVSSIPSGASIARDLDLQGSVAFADQAWFVDASPTPGMPNATGAELEAYGTACTLPGNHLLGLPTLHAPSQPLLGNNQFSLVVDNTTGILGEYVLFGFAAGAAPTGTPSILPPFAGVGCQEAIDTTALVSTWLVPASLLGTSIALPLGGLPPGALGLELHAQALAIDLVAGAYPPYQGLTNALRIVVGQ